MAKTKISEFSSIPGNNTDIDSINIAEGCAPSGINDAIRELMAQLKDFQQGTAGDSFNGPVGTTTAAAGAFTTLSASSAVTLSGGTANGVPYLNGSKVLTTGSALTFDGAKLVNTSGVAGALIQSTDTGGSGSFLRMLGDATSGNLINWTTGTALRFATSTDAFGSFSEQMRLTSTGLGIGTSSPGAKLDVTLSQNGATRTLINNQNSGASAVAGVSLQAYGGGWTIDVPASTTFVNPLQFIFGGTERMRLDSSGNLGLGVTPSAGDSYYRKLELGKPGCGIAAATTALTSSELTYFTGNAVVTYTGGNPWVYGNAGGAGIYGIEDGIHKWSVAGSGTAGAAISFTQAMTLTAAGDLGVGTTSPLAKLHTSGSGTVSSYITTSDSGGVNLYLQVSGSAANIGSPNGVPLTFMTANVERARIDSSGNLLVGKTSSSANGDGAQLFPSGTVGLGHTSGTVTGTAYAAFGYAGGGIGSITQSGTTAVAYNTSSDYRLKENIAPMTGALEKVAALKPVTYTWKVDGSAGEGFIAHELAEVCPAAVTGEKDAVDAEGKPQYQGIDVSFLVGTLTAAIQEQQAIIEDMKTRLAAAGI